ncbi:MAG: hypothetical protein ACI9F9_003012 [Candidatus Paceibacteria bacterium]|jgi:hypothetical protein
MRQLSGCALACNLFRSGRDTPVTGALLSWGLADSMSMSMSVSAGTRVLLSADLKDLRSETSIATMRDKT